MPKRSGTKGSKQPTPLQEIRLEKREANAHLRAEREQRRALEDKVSRWGSHTKRGQTYRRELQNVRRREDRAETKVDKIRNQEKDLRRWRDAAATNLKKSPKSLGKSDSEFNQKYRGAKKSGFSKDPSPQGTFADFLRYSGVKAPDDNTPVGETPKKGS